jgi:hypothetical protein
MAKSKAPPSAPADEMLSIYDGTDFRGGVLQMGAAFVAYDSNGAIIDTFKTMKAAMRAIPRASAS